MGCDPRRTYRTLADKKNARTGRALACITYRSRLSGLGDLRHPAVLVRFIAELDARQFLV